MFKHPHRAPRDPAPLSSGAPFPEAAQLERIRAGDEAVFGQLFKMYYRALCDLVYGYVASRETAEELVQTVFLRVWEKRERWEPAAGMRAYLFGACRNAALDHLKHQRVVERGGTPDGVEPERPDDVVQAEELTTAVRRAIQALPERRRAAVVLRWQHDLTYPEVARALGISVKGVEAHINRALTALRERLADFKP